MTENSKKTADFSKFKFIFLALYFVILTIERVISVVKFCMGGHKTADQLEYYMIMLTLFAIFGSYIYAVIRFMGVVKNHDSDIFSELAIAAGILLLGGMVHTEGSILPMQFASYGMILIAMAFHTAESAKNFGGAAMKWVTFGYITAYSMAIPVVYHTNIELANVFIPIECIVSAGMVGMFTRSKGSGFSFSLGVAVTRTLREQIFADTVYNCGIRRRSGTYSALGGGSQHIRAYIPLRYYHNVGNRQSG